MTAHRLLLLAVLVPAWIAATAALYRAWYRRQHPTVTRAWLCELCGDYSIAVPGTGGHRVAADVAADALRHVALRHTAAPVDVVDR